MGEERQDLQAAVVRKKTLFGYGEAIAVVTVCTVVGKLAFHRFEPVNLVMIYLLGVLFVSSRHGRGPSVLACVLGVGAFDFFLVPPFLTFAVHDKQYFFTFLVMTITGLIISSLTSQVKAQAESARCREQRTAALYAAARDLAATLTREKIAQTASYHVSAACGFPAAVMLPSKDGVLVAYSSGSFELPVTDSSAARWAYEKGVPTGKGTTVLESAKGLYLPLRVSRSTVGVMACLPGREQKSEDVEQVHLLEAFTRLTALAVERWQLAEEAQRVGLEIETERLRSSLLSAVSHDLRTPLAAITGACSALLDREGFTDPKAKDELLESIFEEAEILHRLVTNLLDMTRLDAGALEVHKEWQPIEEVVSVALRRMAAKLRDYDLIVEIPSDLPFVPLDDLLIQQVIINLLENAVKYAPRETKIEIVASYAEDSLVVTVSNEGSTLTNEDLEHVFDKFYRSVGLKQKTGAGLGLAICKGIVGLHAGKIWCENRTGGGVSFSFTLPIDGTPPVFAPEDAENS